MLAAGRNVRMRASQTISRVEKRVPALNITADGMTSRDVVAEIADRRYSSISGQPAYQLVLVSGDAICS